MTGINIWLTYGFLLYTPRGLNLIFFRQTKYFAHRPEIKTFSENLIFEKEQNEAMQSINDHREPWNDQNR